MQNLETLKRNIGKKFHGMKIDRIYGSIGNLGVFGSCFLKIIFIIRD